MDRPAKITRMTVDQYIENREDMTNVVLVESEYGYEICLRLDGSYHDKGIAEAQLKFVSAVLGIPVRREGFE